MSFIFPDKKEEQLKLINEQLRNLGSRLNEYEEAYNENHKLLIIRHTDLNDKVQRWIDNTDALKTSLNAQGAKISLLANSGSSKEIGDLIAKLERLELWKADIMNMLTETNPATKRPRLTKIGKKLAAFYNQEK